MITSLEDITSHIAPRLAFLLTEGKYGNSELNKMSIGRNFNPDIKERKTDTQTYEGAPAYTYEDARNELIAAVATTFLDDKFYESATDRMERVRGLIKAIASEGHYRFLWNLVKYTRDEWHLRSISHLLAGEYLLIPEVRTWKSMDGTEKTVDPVQILVDHVFIRPDDVAKIFGYWMINNTAKANTKQKMPRLLRKAVQVWFNKLSRFQASKYQARLAGKQITMKKLIKMTHPKPKDKAQSELFKEIIAESLSGDANWTKDITAVVVDEETGETLSTKDKWLKAIPKMAYMPLLMNLAAFDRAGVDPAIVLPTLVNKEAVLKSRLLPFRFITAIDHVERHYKEALRTAFQMAFDNVKLPRGNYLIAVDQSTSMTMNNTGKSTRDCMEDAAIFGAVVQHAANKAGDRADLVMFGSELTEHNTFDMGVVGTIAYLRRMASGGATNGYLIWEYYEAQKAKGIKYDYIFIMTDMQFTSVNRGYGTGILSGYGTSRYQSGGGTPTVPKDVLIFNIDLQGYKTTLTPYEKASNVKQMSGFSEKIFDYLDVIRDPQGLIQKIENS